MIESNTSEKKKFDWRKSLTWNKRNAYPLGGKYDLDSALWGQSTTNGPNRRNDDVISSGVKEKNIFISRHKKQFDDEVVSTLIDLQKLQQNITNLHQYPAAVHRQTLF